MDTNEVGQKSDWGKRVCAKIISIWQYFSYKNIRNHWGIENRLHWVKDVCMNEDKSQTISGMAAENISILQNIVINLFRTNGTIL